MNCHPASEQLRRIADVAEKRNRVPAIRLPVGIGIDLLGVAGGPAGHLMADLDMPSGYAYGRSSRTVKTCVEATSAGRCG